MAIQMISLTRQMMLTKMPRAAESPKAAIESTKPPSCTPICMGRKPIILAKRVVKATIRMLWRNVSVSPPNPPPQSMPNKRSMNITSKLCTTREENSKKRLL